MKNLVLSINFLDLIGVIYLKMHRTLVIDGESLWNRAGSFDVKKSVLKLIYFYVSIPLEQGRVFRLELVKKQNPKPESQSL